MTTRNILWFFNGALARRISPALLVTFFFLTETLTHGGEFRLSFLDSGAVLDDTCAMMQRAGFPEPTVNDFKRLVKHHNRDGHRVDVRRFVSPKEGYYTFAGIADLTNRMTSIFGNTPANNEIDQNTFMCFDVASLLLRGAGHGAPLLYEEFAAKSILAVSPERDVAPAVLASFRTGIGVLYPSNGYDYLLGRPRSEPETQLGLALRAARKLRSGLSDSNTDLREIHREFIRQIKADGFSFPTNCDLGLVFYVDLKRGFIKADHAFICIRHGDRLVTVEKNSSPGPYVRAEFGELEDLALYSSLGERRDTNNPKDCDFGSSVVISLNERIIGTFRPAHRR